MPSHSGTKHLGPRPRRPTDEGFALQATVNDLGSNLLGRDRFRPIREDGDIGDITRTAFNTVLPAAGLIASEGIVPGFTTFLSGTQVPASAAFLPSVSPQAVARAGLGGLLDLNSLRQQQSQAAFAQARNQSEAARLQQEFNIRERDRRNRLRRAVAAERARFGGAGISSAGGSAAAIVRGLQSKTDEDTRLDREGVNLRRRSLLEESRPQARSGFQTFQRTISPFINLLD